MSHPNTKVVNLKGENGSILIQDTNQYAGPFDAIEALADAVVDLSGGNMQGVVSAVPINAGVTVFGVFPTVTPASGIVVAYFKNQQINVAPPPVQPIPGAPPQQVPAPV